MQSYLGGMINEAMKNESDKRDTLKDKGEEKVKVWQKLKYKVGDSSSKVYIESIWKKWPLKRRLKR